MMILNPFPTRSSSVFLIIIGLMFCCYVPTLSERPKETPEYWKDNSRKELLSSLEREDNRGRARNIIFCMGDGMGLGTITAMRHYKNEVAGKLGEMNDLFFETFPNTGLVKAYTTTQTIADSAATATAYMTGMRTKTYMVNVDDTVELDDCESLRAKNAPKPITKLAKEAGKSVGMVTTSRVSHATPATSYANSVNRWWEVDNKVPLGYRDKCPDISRQFVEKGQHMDVMLAGGRSRFLPRNETDPEYGDRFGKRTDGRNLIKEWQHSKLVNGLNGSFVYDRDGFDRIDPERTDSILGLFDHSHMHFEADRLHDLAGEPSLTEMAEKAIRLLQKNENGFFLFIEGARIDHGHHSGKAKYAITDGLEFERAIQKAVEMTDSKETLVIVTADHSHSMQIVGYKGRDKPLFGLSNSYGLDGMPYTTLLYSIGPGYGRKNLTNVDTESLDYSQQSAVPAYEVSHAGEDLSVYAQGPWSHLIHKLTEQTYIHEVMLYAGCLGEYRTKKRCRDRGEKTVNTRNAAAQGLSNCNFNLVLISLLISLQLLSSS